MHTSISLVAGISQSQTRLAIRLGFDNLQVLIYSLYIYLQALLYTHARNSYSVFETRLPGPSVSHISIPRT